MVSMELLLSVKWATVSLAKGLYQVKQIDAYG